MANEQPQEVKITKKTSVSIPILIVIVGVAMFIVGNILSTSGASARNTEKIKNNETEIERFEDKFVTEKLFIATIKPLADDIKEIKEAVK